MTEAREKLVALFKTPPVRRTKGWPEEVDIERLADLVLALEGENWRIAVVEKHSGFPEPDMHPPEMVLIRFLQALRKEGWVKEVGK